MKISSVTEKQDIGYDNWDHEYPVKYSKYLEKTFGAPEQFTNEQTVWQNIDGFKRVVVRDEYILHGSPAPHYDFVYCYVDLEVPEELSDELANCSGSILIDHLKNEVGARCGSLTANATTLNFVMDVVAGRVEPVKEEYEARILGMKKQFKDGERYELDWWSDEAGDSDPDNEFYAEGTEKISTRRNITTKTTIDDQGRSSEKVNTSNIRNTDNTGTTDVFKRSVKTINPDNTTSKQSSKTLVRPDNTFTTTDSKGNKTKGYDSIFKHRPKSLKEADIDQSLIQKIKDKAVEYGIDPALLLSIAYKETRIRTGLTGDKDRKNKAHGVFQVRKPALDDVNGYYKTKFTVDDMKNSIDDNIDAGARYLMMMVDRYGAKNTKQQLAMYNGGPGAKKGRNTGANSYADSVMKYKGTINDIIDDDKNNTSPVTPSKNKPFRSPYPKRRPTTIPIPKPRPKNLDPDVDFGDAYSDDFRTNQQIAIDKALKSVIPPVPLPKPKRKANKLTYLDLAKMNKISDPDKITVGQKIKLPDGSKYVVQKGDSLSNITKLHNRVTESISMVKPQFDVEWEEANRYPYIEKLGQQGWEDLAQNGVEVTINQNNIHKIGNTGADGSEKLSDLEPDKVARLKTAFRSGTVEMPIVVKQPDGSYDLVAGNTRLIGLITHEGEAKVWLVDASSLSEATSSPGRVKRAGASCSGSVTELRALAKKHSGTEKGKMYHWCANMKGGKKESIQEVLTDVTSSTQVFVDMDGVLADFFGEWKKLIGSDWRTVKDIEPALQKIRDTEDFWLDLPMLPQAKNLLAIIKDLKGSYTILSSPLPDDPNSEPHKRQWIDKYLSFFPPEKVIITHNKTPYATNSDGSPNILIDDFGQNVSKWEAAGGVGFKHKDHKFERTAKAIQQHMSDPAK